MSNCCEVKCTQEEASDWRYRKVLWAALLINAGMFIVEIFGSVKADSVSLMADAADFLGDAANYGISISVLAMAPIWRSRAAFIKGISMGVYGLFVLGRAIWSVYAGTVPEATTMGIIGIIALVANVIVAAMLFRFRTGDANMKSVWLCSRNDAIGNVAVIIAALCVYVSMSKWPDLAVAFLMSALGIVASAQVLKSSIKEMKT